MPQTINSIQTIRDYFNRHNGLQLSNRYDIYFYNVPSTNQNVEVQAQAISIGPRAIDSIVDNLQGYGAGRFVPRYQSVAARQGVLVTFPVTNDNYIIQFINNWFNYFYSSPLNNGTFVLPYYDDAVKQTTMQIRLLDPNGNQNNLFTFTEVFPVETLPLDMSMMNSNTYLNYQVTFGYRDLITTNI